MIYNTDKIFWLMSSGNYISVALLIMCFINTKEKNKKTLESELKDIMRIDGKI